VTPETDSESVLVVGLGNPLMGDDGFGPAVIEALEASPYPPNVTLCTAPDVLRLADLWRDEASVWLVDVVVRNARPGTIHRFEDDAVRSMPPHPASSHHLAFGVSLQWLLHALPAMRRVRFRLWGVEPAEIAPGGGLSPQTSMAVAKVAREILRAAVEAVDGPTPST